MHVKSLQSHPTVTRLLGSSVHGILQARMEWIVMPSFCGSSWPRNQTLISYVSCTGGRGVRGSLPLGPPGKPHTHYLCLYCVLVTSVISNFVQPALWTVALSAALSMAFSRQEYWSGLQCPSPEDLSNPGIKPTFFMYPALAGGFFNTRTTWEASDLIWPDLDVNLLQEFPPMDS